MQLPSVMFGQGFAGNLTINQRPILSTPVVAEKKKWMQDVKIKRKGICTGDKFGSKSCPPGSRQYALAQTFHKGSKTSAAHRKAKSK